MVECQGLVKIFRASGVEVFALQGLDLAVAKGEMIAVVGNSGSGKSTLMNMLGGLDGPSAGTARVGEWDLTALTPRERDRYRKQVTGFVWQNSGLNLIPYLTALDNVRLALSLTRKPATAEAMRLLELVGVGHRRDRLARELSGGEQQRVAVAVALANQPSLLLADEPTGSLDRETAHLVMEALQQINRELGTTIILVTHDMEMTRYVHRAVRIRDGKVATEVLHGAGDEVLVLDGVGRLQIPRPMLQAAGIGLRAQVTLRGDEVVVRRP